MRGIEIKEQIDSNNKLIEELMKPNTFTLNNTISKLLKENIDLQNQCQHDFEEGFCVYCYKEEGKE